MYYYKPDIFWKRGILLIFNTKEIILFCNFSVFFQYETRFGSSTDCNNLSETFQAFGFKIEIFENLKRKEMLEKIKNISKDHDNKYDCLFLCILSHGYRGKNRV